MTQAVVDKKVCDKCGADARQGATFCYNCGSPAAITKPEEPIAGRSPNGSESSSEKRSRAAIERKKARVDRRKVVEYTWEPTSDSTLTLIASIVLFAIVVIATVVLVIWK